MARMVFHSYRVRISGLKNIDISDSQVALELINN
jgi:hypothetical protein